MSSYAVKLLIMDPQEIEQPLHSRQITSPQLISPQNSCISNLQEADTSQLRTTDTDEPETYLSQQTLSARSFCNYVIHFRWQKHTNAHQLLCVRCMREERQRSVLLDSSRPQTCGDCTKKLSNDTKVRRKLILSWQDLWKSVHYWYYLRKLQLVEAFEWFIYSIVSQDGFCVMGILTVLFTLCHSAQQSGCKIERSSLLLQFAIQKLIT